MARLAKWMATVGLLAVLVSSGTLAAEVDRSKLQAEPAGFRLDGDAERGAVVFQKSCALCHGPKGEGNGRIKTEPPPRDLTDPKALRTESDWELYQVTVNGGQILGLSPRMLPWKDTLDEQELLDVATYVRSLAPHGPPPP